MAWHDGTISHFLFPETAILLTASTDLLNQRLATRSNFQREKSYDPKDQLEVIERQLVYQSVFSNYKNTFGISCFEFDVSNSTRANFSDAVSLYQQTFVQRIFQN